MDFVGRGDFVRFRGFSCSALGFGMVRWRDGWGVPLKQARL